MIKSLHASIYLIASYGRIFSCVLLLTIGAVLLVVMTCMAGISVFAYYAHQGCDPLSAREITSSNNVCLGIDLCSVACFQVMHAYDARPDT